MIKIILGALLALALSCEKNDLFPVYEKPIEVFLASEEINNKPFLKIKSPGFKKDFFLYGSFIPMLSSTTGYSLRGRLVSFHPFDDRVIMLESPKGHSIASENESVILLAEFPIVRTDKDGVLIDFNRGMNSAFTMRNVHAQASINADPTTSEQFRSIALANSFVRSITNEQNVMSINQFAQWRNSKSELISAEFRYFLREYAPYENFEKTFYGSNRWVQFFKTPPMLLAPTTEKVSYTTKWELSEPIVFYISSNTPKDYEQAIIDGVMFWNNFIGNIIEVKKLPEGLSAPNARLNIIQWVAWDNEASAYADMVVDHLSGRIMQAQIYLHSGWVSQSAEKLRNQLSDIVFSETKPSIDSVLEAPMPSMFDFDEPCFLSLYNLAELDFRENFSDISDETLKLLTGDIIRAVIAHEMGHVLGLRHNLAGSLLGISLSARKNALKSYLRNGEYSLPLTEVFSSSIMDVFSAVDDAIIGAQIRKLLADDENKAHIKDIFQYDKQALDYSYFKKPMLKNMAFCTDEDMEKFLDCSRWDISNTPVVFASNRINSAFEQIATSLADTIIKVIDPERKGGPQSVNDISLDTTEVQKIIEGYVKNLFSWLKKDARSVLVEKDFEALGVQNQEMIANERFESVLKESEADGINTTFFGLLPPFSDEEKLKTGFMNRFISHFEQRLSGLSNKDYQEDLSNAKKLAGNFYETLRMQIIDQILSVVITAEIDAPKLAKTIETALGQIAEEIIFAQKDQTTMPAFKYELKTRELAAKLLNPAIGNVADWSLDNLIKTGTRLKWLMKKGLGSQSTDVSTIPREQRQWLMDQNRILNTLMQLKNMSRPLIKKPKHPKTFENPPT